LAPGQGSGQRPPVMLEPDRTAQTNRPSAHALRKLSRRQGFSKVSPTAVPHHPLRGDGKHEPPPQMRHGCCGQQQPLRRDRLTPGPRFWRRPPSPLGRHREADAV
jgi:hypothetical protein